MFGCGAGVFSVSKIPYVFCGVFQNYISCDVVGNLCCSLFMYADFLFMFLNGVTKLRKTWNYKQGWEYSKLRCSPKYPQPKGTDIFMSVIVFCVNLLHTTLCRLLFVISVYFTLCILLLFVFFSYQSIMWFGLYKVIGSTKGHGRLECSCVL